MSEPAVIHTDETFVLVRTGALLCAMWWDAPRPDQIKRISDAGREMERELGRPGAFAQFIVDGTPRFSTDARDEAAKISAEALFGIGSAHIIELAGIKMEFNLVK